VFALIYMTLIFSDNVNTMYICVYAVWVLCESTAAEAVNDRQITENECRRKAEQKATNRRRRDDPHKGPHKSGPPHRGLHKAANRRPQTDPHRKHTNRFNPI